ncbi:hypothetical protein ACFVFH_15250 [Streptomyces sp. NPDC057697]|uniref:hypothetical protein n=1 Tax=Streptomyces sp. NPDC057697 TaxID=3346219 RepID=UPI00367B64E8
MDEISDVSDAPTPPLPPPPADAHAPDDGDVLEKSDAGVDVQSSGEVTADDVEDGDVPEQPEPTAGGQATDAQELEDGDIGVRETSVEQPDIEPASAGQQPPGGSEPPEPPTPAGPPDGPDRSVPPDDRIVVEEAEEDQKLPDAPTALEQKADDAPSQGLETAPRSEQVGAVTDETEDGTTHDGVRHDGEAATTAGTTRSDQPVAAEEEAIPLGQADEQRPAAPEASKEPETRQDPDRTRAAEADAPGDDADADHGTRADEEQKEPADVGLAEGAEKPSSPESENAGEAVDVVESDSGTGMAENVESEGTDENTPAGPATDEARPQEPQDGADPADSPTAEETDSRAEGPDSRERTASEPQTDSGQPSPSIQERIRQAVGAARNWANDTYLGRLVAGRPMEPWKSNRALHRSLDGARPPANAVVADLENIGRGNGVIGYKDANAKLRPDADLINSVFAPRDGQYISTHVDNPGVIGQGNHRAEELLKRAKDPDNQNIDMTTPIFIHRVGETEADADTAAKEQE